MRLAPYVTSARVNCLRRADGSLILTNPHPLRPAFANVVEPLAHWADHQPQRVWLAGFEGGAWRTLNFRDGWRMVSALAAGLYSTFPRGSVIAVASGNSISHALLTYAAPLAGLAIAPITPAYAIKARDPRRLHEALQTLGAQAVFMESHHFATPALWAEEIGVRVLSPGDGFGTYDELSLDKLFGDPDDAPAWQDLDPQDACKYLLTSGSTGTPKAVTVTHQNLAMNAAQIRSTFDPDLEAQIWPDGIMMANHLPWSHSLGGNAVLHMLLHAGGSLWIDPGTPTAQGLDASIATIKHVKPNYHLTVPLGWSLLASALERDEELASALFSRLVIMQYGGAALTQDVYRRLQEVALRITGEEITLAAGYGATETAPTVCNVHWPNDVMGLVGLPVPGLELKLVPHGTKWEARVRGPGITPGYLNAPDKTKDVFDEEAFYKLGDALAFVDPLQPHLGLVFDGRLSEEFKLANGSFVPAGLVRPALVQASKGLFSDVVICGEGQKEVSALAFVNLDKARALSGLEDDLPSLIWHATVRSSAKKAMIDAGKGQPQTRRVTKLILLSTPPSLEVGEITDKGYLNQARCRACRANSVAALYSPSFDHERIEIE
ncbi:AMP-binding protein [Candidatus Phycosocius spiralis]|uniref:Feruloyl-CoA synthase n=1 Tax=Candidatus Phycosocius spiralis TaxID=2815099 RepID=A0ABQ4PWC0_9PROT|nr:AMP-binding protein [Candidatus Phycosocius spiralis]GIU67303.1 feruloyl-CoA synthase [Candidatus Phycosocius spiralis]